MNAKTRITAAAIVALIAASVTVAGPAVLSAGLAHAVASAAAATTTTSATPDNENWS